MLAKRVSVLDLLERFASSALPFARFLELLPPMQAAPLLDRVVAAGAKPAAARSTVAVLDAPAWSGTGRYRGTCSNYLAQLAPGTHVFGRVVSPNTPFLLPDDPATPIIMIGAGTGIAPFRGFLQERGPAPRAGTRLGPAQLFFGCDHPDVDFLYRDELAAWERLGAVERAPGVLPRRATVT